MIMGKEIITGLYAPPGYSERIVRAVLQKAFRNTREKIVRTLKSTLLDAKLAKGFSTIYSI